MVSGASLLNFLQYKENTFPAITENWWAERGSIRWVFDEDALDQVVRYTLDGQDWKPDV